MKLGEKLVQLRKVRGMSQEALAAQIAVSRQAVSRWESGDTLPDVEKVLQLSKIFGVTTDYLLREEYGPEGEGTPIREAARQPETEGLLQSLEPPRLEKKNSGSSRAMLVAGGILAGIGLAGHLVIWVLSTMIESSVPTATTDSQGVTWYSTGPGFSYSGFIERYRLYAVVGVLWLLLVLGGVLLLWYYYKWKESRAEKEEL